MCLGVLDSGIGGLSILSAIRAQLPQVDIVYIADQANLPYGPRSLTVTRPAPPR
jgi:glutamate racemase